MQFLYIKNQLAPPIGYYPDVFLAFLINLSKASLSINPEKPLSKIYSGKAKNLTMTGFNYYLSQYLNANYPPW
jgi:hypothetical protein